jgi:hypothetical protein
MTMLDDDRDLRERFGALRGEDERAAPDFARLSRRPAPRLPRWRALAWAGAAALVVLAVVLGRPWSSRAPRQSQAAPSITTWTSPTDFLLETPGRQLLQAAPASGRRWIEFPPPSSFGSGRPL